jgi:hypothetical protein
MSPIESISIPEASRAAPPLNCEERIRLAQLETLIEGSLEKFLVVSRIVRVVTGAIDKGCGNAQKPKRVECEELSFLRPVFRLARIPFPDAELFAAHFGDDQEKAARAFAACREHSARCQSICIALVRHFPELGQCKQPKATIDSRG